MQPKPIFKTKLGQLYKGDSIRILPKLKPGFDAVITDPPYNSGGRTKGQRSQTTIKKYNKASMSKYGNFTGDNKDQKSFYAWGVFGGSMCHDLLKKGGYFCFFSDWWQVPVSTDIIQCSDFIWKGVGVWDKKNSRPTPASYRNQCEYLVWGTKGQSPKREIYLPGLWRQATVSANKRAHMTQKPLEVMLDIIKIVPEKCKILDPFAGSGTTPLACELTNRKWVAIEKSQKNCNIIIDRIKNKGMN